MQYTQVWAFVFVILASKVDSRSLEEVREEISREGEEHHCDEDEEEEEQIQVQCGGKRVNLQGITEEWPVIMKSPEFLDTTQGYPTDMV